MDEITKQEWREAYRLAHDLVAKRGIETSLLAVGMMLRQSLDKNLEKWLTQVRWDGDQGAS